MSPVPSLRRWKNSSPHPFVVERNHPSRPWMHPRVPSLALVQFTLGGGQAYAQAVSGAKPRKVNAVTYGRESTLGYFCETVKAKQMELFCV